MKIKRFLENIENHEESVKDAFIEIGDSFEIRIKKEFNIYIISIILDTNSDTFSLDESLKLMSDIKTAVSRIKNVEKSNIKFNKSKIDIWIYLEEENNFSNMFYIEDGILKCDENKIRNFLLHQGHDDVSIGTYKHIKNVFGKKIFIDVNSNLSPSKSIKSVEEIQKYVSDKKIEIDISSERNEEGDYQSCLYINVSKNEN